MEMLGQVTPAHQSHRLLNVLTQELLPPVIFRIEFEEEWMLGQRETGRGWGRRGRENCSQGVK